MKNKVGVLRRPSEKYKEVKRPTFLIGLMTIILIVSFIFTLKTYEPAKNVIITGGILVYPFTYLIMAYISKYYGIKQAHKSVFMSAILFALFFLLIMICLIPNANNATTSYNAIVQYVFANDYFMIGNTHIFFPTMGQFCGTIIAFITSHLLFASIYNAIHSYTIDYLAMGLSVFISAIIDRIIFTPILLLENLLDGSNTFEFFIKCLTSEFIATIALVTIMIVIYVIITHFKDSKKTSV